MNCGDLIKHKFQKEVDSCLDKFSVERRLSYGQMESMQFCICDYAPKQVEEAHFFHY